MSKLDKDKVLADFTEAYQQAHGKQPKIEASGGWYSVDGGKNMRLAQLAEQVDELKGGAKKATKSAAKKPAKEAAKPAAKAAPAKKAAAAKAPAKKAAPVKKAAAKKSASAKSGGLTAKELWKKKLEEDATLSRLPRGYDS
ncbi:MAG TPA: hypothetical protein VFM61_01285 [Pseudidiomarina sp.]|nr:hypothetical protein [Pseudidiomarina sp.]